MEVGELRRAIREVKPRTNRPFGVNLLLPHDLRPPVSSRDITDEAITAVQSALNPLREKLGLPSVTSRPSAPADAVPEKIEVILAENVPLFSIGLGNPGPELVERFHQRRTKVIAMVTNAEDAMAIEAAGVDAVVAQGVEAGGHRSHFVKSDNPASKDLGTFTLVPEVAQAVTIPVIAAGGITDGRGLLAALALGAQGVMMGSRFVTARESIAPQLYKEAVVNADGSGTTLTDALSGRYARVLRNKYTDHYAQTGAPTLPLFWQTKAAQDIFDLARERGDADYPLWAGQGVGNIRAYPSAEELMARIIREAHNLLDTLAQQVRFSD